ncbi:MAG: UvrD-helicase domain-containing protein [Myxococcales bacterium]|nr:UvrD-helicase domain-containing protein [Myxococcales bacterium]
MPETTELILKDLNPAQREAVTAPDGPLLVFAGAGSGKTRVLTRRIAYLLVERGLHPSEVFAVTFTNKAAQVMQDRVEQLIGRHARGMWIHTFHGACVRLLRSHAERVGRKPGFSIYDEADQQQVVKELMPICDLDPQDTPPRQITHWFDLAKNEGADPSERGDLAPPPIRHKFQHLAELYRRRLREANAFDFGDLIVETVRLLRDNPEIAAAYRRRFRHLLVDEFQDTNRAQYQLLAELLDDHRCLTVVGDDDQSIYRWRGARLANILEFERVFPDAKVVILGTNYRSTSLILRAANAVIARNVGRKPKEMNTPNPLGAPLVRCLADDEYEEARFVGRTIDELRLRHGLRPAEIAVFYRVNAQSRILEEKLLERGIPYTVVGGTRFYDRKEIKDAIAYLRLQVNPADALAFARAINVPARGIGEKTQARLLQYATEKSLSPIAACAAAAEGDAEGFGPKLRQELGRFARLFRQPGADLFGNRPSQIAGRLLRDSGYLDLLEKSQKIEDRSRLENLQELLKSIEEFEKDIGEEATLADFLEKVSLLSDPDMYDERVDAVSLMTLHAAKGLEFPAVFMIGLEDGLLPHSRSRDDPAEIEEERRLAYVGVTRARQYLYWTAAAVRRSYGGIPTPTRLSPFWHDPPPDAVTDVGPTRAPSWGSDFIRRAAPAPAPAAVESGEPVYDYADSQDPDDLQSRLVPGCRIRHPQFGAGTLLTITGSGAMSRATVAFDRYGTKTLILKYANLTWLGAAR